MTAESDLEARTRSDVVTHMDELAKAAGYGGAWVAIQHVRVGRRLGGGLDVPFRALSRLLNRSDPFSIDYEPTPQADRVVVCDPGQVKTVRDVLAVLNISDRVDVVAVSGAPIACVDRRLWDAALAEETCHDE